MFGYRIVVCHRVFWRWLRHVVNEYARYLQVFALLRVRRPVDNYNRLTFIVYNVNLCTKSRFSMASHVTHLPDQQPPLRM